MRRATLTSLLRKAGKGIRLSEHIDGADGKAVFQHACAMGLEGIGAKRRDGPYHASKARPNAERRPRKLTSLRTKRAG